MVKGFQYHSNHLPQLFDLKTKKKKNPGISKELLHSLEPSATLRHAYSCSRQKGCVQAAIIFLFVS